MVMSNLLSPLFARRRQLGVAGSLLCLFGSLGCLGTAQLSTGIAYDEPVVYVEPAPVVYRRPVIVRAEPVQTRVYRTRRYDGYGPSGREGYGPNGRDAYRPRHRGHYSE
jgi:hypothetical protein